MLVILTTFPCRKTHHEEIRSRTTDEGIAQLQNLLISQLVTSRRPFTTTIIACAWASDHAYSYAGPTTYLGMDQTRLTPSASGTGGGGNGGAASQKTLTAEKKNQCPYGDTRWPPANISISKPLHLLSDESEEPIYYHLIHENNSPQVEFWKGPVKAQAIAAYAEKGLALPISKAGKSKKEIKVAKERALEDEAPRAKTEIEQARNTKMLKELSSGPRGTLWQLDEEHLHVWRCIEVIQKVHGAVNLSAERREIFSMFGVGLKRIDGDILMVSQKA